MKRLLLMMQWYLLPVTKRIQLLLYDHLKPRVGIKPKEKTDKTCSWENQEHYLLEIYVHTVISRYLNKPTRQGVQRVPT